jgi:hypothetical protein
MIAMAIPLLAMTAPTVNVWMEHAAVPMASLAQVARHQSAK